MAQWGVGDHLTSDQCHVSPGGFLTSGQPGGGSFSCAFNVTCKLPWLEFYSKRWDINDCNKQ